MRRRFAFAGLLPAAATVAAATWAALAPITLPTRVQMLRPISPIAWIPIAILWFGVGEASPIFLIFISSVFPMIVQTTSGVHLPRPTTIQATFEVNLPHPRRLASPEAQALREAILKELGL